MKFHEIFDFSAIWVLNRRGGVRCLGLFPKKNRFFFYAFSKYLIFKYERGEIEICNALCEEAASMLCNEEICGDQKQEISEKLLKAAQKWIVHFKQAHQFQFSAQCGWCKFKCVLWAWNIVSPRCSWLSFALLWWCISSIARGRRGYPEYPWSANVSGRGRDINHNSIIWSSQPGQFMAPYGGPYSPWYGDLYGSIHGQWSTGSLAILCQGLQLLFLTIMI